MLQKFSAILNEIVINYPDDLPNYLEQKLQIPNYKAKELAQRLETDFNLKLNHDVRRKLDECSSSTESLNNQEEKNFSIYSLDSLSGKEFEQFLKWFFEELGYIVRLTSLTTDSGVDLVIVKNEEKIAVQAKRYKRTNKVPNSVILKTRGGQDIHGCDRSMIVTTSFFTKQAIKEAKQLKIELWDRNFLSASIDQINQKIVEIKKKPSFPEYSRSLVTSLLNLDQTGIFYVKQLKNERYHIYRHGLTRPLATFKTQRGRMKKFVFRIKNNQPISESKGHELIHSDAHYTYGPKDAVAYEQIMNYLSKFIC